MEDSTLSATPFDVGQASYDLLTFKTFVPILPVTRLADPLHGFYRGHRGREVDSSLPHTVFDAPKGSTGVYAAGSELESESAGTAASLPSAPSRNQIRVAHGAKRLHPVPELTNAGRGSYSYKCEDSFLLPMSDAGGTRSTLFLGGRARKPGQTMQVQHVNQDFCAGT